MRKIKKDIPNRSKDQHVFIELTVNGQKIEREVSTRMLLTDFLRHELGLTGTHVGCEHGICGACTVLINNKAGRACLMFASHVSGADVKTIESVANQDGSLNPLQKAFQENHALQCGYCTPGMIMNIMSSFNSNIPIDSSDNGIRELISGNLCRCTGYANIVKAVQDAIKEMDVKTVE
tara:strand:+ start:288 stop:821 length:534 start_codon:yes stop_codon:yes gene_type:complete